MTSIYALKKTEYAQGSKLAFKNSQDLLKVAEKAAQIENYGIASAMCVLSLEELSKSIILCMFAKDNKLPVKHLDKYFYDHQIKQNVGINVFMSLLVDDFESFIQKEENKLKGAVLLLALVFVALFSNSHTYKKDKNGRKTSKSSFDKVKESGFYTSYCETDRAWKSPSDAIDQKDYEGFYELLKEYAKVIETWIYKDKLEDALLDHIINNLDDSIIEKSRLNKMRKV